MRNRLLAACLVACALGSVFVSMQAQTATRLFATLSSNLTTGISTPVTCTQSGNGCSLDVTMGTGSVFPEFIPLGGTTSAFPALKRNGAGLDIRLADDSNYANVTAGSITGAGNISAGSAASFRFAATPLLMATAPTISSGFGTSPSIVSSNGAASFRVNVGTGGAATSGVVGLPTASNGWNCLVQDMTNNTATRMSASTTTTATITAAAAWAASDILAVSCFAY